MSLLLDTKMNNDTLTETLNRLAKAVADYEAFVRTTRSYQLAIEGVREARGTRPNRYSQRCQMIEEHGRLTSENK
jgi:hypothetical protein